MKRSALALAFALCASSALAQISDVQLRPGSSAIWGAIQNQTGLAEVSQYNTSGSVVDSFRWLQGANPTSATFLYSVSPTGAIFGPATGGRMGAGTINAKGFYVDGAALTVSPGGTPGQIQYNNAGTFGGFTTSGDATINTSTGALTLATVNANVGSFGSATNCVTFTTNAKGLITAASQATCTPAIASVTGLGTGVATALGVNVGSAGALLLNNNNTVSRNNLAQGVARSVIGVTGNATANVADIQGATDQVLRVNGAGTALAFGAIDISKAAAVTGTLAAGNGGTGATSLLAADLTVSGGALQLSAGRRTLPTVQTFTTGSGTYTTPANVLWIEVTACGGGGGGGGSSTSASGATSGGAGGNTTFGTAFLTANGGAGASATNGTQSTGGTATGGDRNLTGGNGAAPSNTGVISWGGAGAIGLGGLGNAGIPGIGANPGGAATGFCAGGAGAGSSTTVINLGGGGAGGGLLYKIVNTPNATYAYSVGAAGTAGTAGTGGAAGGAGASGYIQVIEHYGS